jgi:hypothetical protein
MQIRYLQSNHDFESVINSPLSTSKGTNHDNTKRKSSGEKTHEAHLLNSLVEYSTNIRQLTANTNIQQEG